MSKPTSKTETLFLFFISLYALGALVCFGLSYNLDYESDPQHSRTEGGDNTIRAMACAAAWPLWVSMKASQSLRPERNAKP